MTNRDTMLSMASSGGLMSGVMMAVLCLMMAFCAEVSAESINRKAVSIWRRGFLEMNEAAEKLKANQDRDAYNQYCLAVAYFEEVREKYPDFEPDMVLFRLNDCNIAIEQLRQRHPNDIFFANLRVRNERMEELANENRMLQSKNKKLEEDFSYASNELRQNSENELIKRMLTAARQFDKLLDDAHGDPASSADARARFKQYAKEVQRLRDILYPQNYVVGGIVNGLWMLEPKTGEPIFIKPDDVKKRGIPAILMTH